MDADSFDARSRCSSELSETESELEARIYGIIHHNDFSGTTFAPSIDPKYGVEFSAQGEVIVYLKNPADIVATDDSAAAPSSAVGSRNNSVIPTIISDDDDVENPKDNVIVINDEFDDTTSLKKKKKKKKKKAGLQNIEEYITIVKTTKVLEEYKEKSGLNKMHPRTSGAAKVALNVAFHNERALPMSSYDVLKQYRIGKPTECSLWYRCPQTWTSDMVKYYTKIQKSKRNFDCAEELQKIKEKYGSSPIDWTLSPMDMYNSSNSPKIRCNICRQFGHTTYNCKDQYKPEICIMCGLPGHNFHSCNKKLCLSCGTRQKKFTNNCNTCISMSKTKCDLCHTVGHLSNYCTESWRQFHSTISTTSEHERNEFAQSTSRSNFPNSRSTKRKFENSSTPSTSNNNKTSHDADPKSQELYMSRRQRRVKRMEALKQLSKTTNSNNFLISENKSINIAVNIQDNILKRTRTKKKFVKKKKSNDSFKS